MSKVPAVMHRVATMFAILAAITLPVAAQDFVPGFEDLPLMRGLSPVVGSGHIFDSPSGRLIESHARGPVARVRVETFYNESLTALGWTPAGAGRYRREKEILQIETSGQDGDLAVVFRLAPYHR